VSGWKNWKNYPGFEMFTSNIYSSDMSEPFLSLEAFGELGDTQV